MMELILSGLTWTECLVYLDDIIVFGDSFESTLNHIEHLFQRLSAAGATVKAKKCKFFHK